MQTDPTLTLNHFPSTSFTGITWAESTAPFWAKRRFGSGFKSSMNVLDGPSLALSFYAVLYEPQTPGTSAYLCGSYGE